MHYYEIKNLRSYAVSGANGNTFAEACRIIGWNPDHCQVLRVW